MAQGMVTFKDIVDAISEAIGVQKDDLNARNKIKRFVNMYYVDEVIPFKPWTWLQKTTTRVHEAYYGTGTCAVTPASSTVTLSVVPNASEGSFKNYKFSVSGSNKVYTVSAHEAESTTVTLSGDYQESLNATAAFKIWRDCADLPADAKETVSIYHAERGKPLDALGPQGLRKLEAANAKAEGFPSAYSTLDFFDPSDEDGESESDRYRQVRIFPAITATPVTLNIDYIQEIVELSDDYDEPVMPISDRVVLYYGAGALAWSVISRNEEMHDKWQMKANAKLSRMAGDRDTGFDAPTLVPQSNYLNSIRRSGLGRRSSRASAPATGGQSSVALPSYLKDVTIDGAAVIDDVTVSAGTLIDGRDISEDGALLDSIFGTTRVDLTDGSTNQVAAAWNLTQRNVIFLRYSIKRNTDYEVGSMTIITDGSTISSNQFGVSQVGDPEVAFSVSLGGGQISLLATLTSTGSDASFEYLESYWLM